MDGKLQYEIAADASSLRNEIASSLASLGKLTAGITAAAAGAGLIGAGAGIGLSVKVAAEREQVRIAFKNIIGDAKEADKTLKDLFSFSNSTPFESGEIQAAALKLINAGVATKDLRTELTALGNVAAGVNTDIGGLASIYSQISDKGKVMAEELMQLGERGAGAIKTQLAKELGVTKEQLTEMTSQGQVSFGQFRAALQSLAGPTGAWGRLMEEQALSTIGLFSSLKDAANEVFAALGQPINDAIKPVLTDAIGLAEQLKPAVAEVGTAVGGAVTAMRDFISDSNKGGSVVAQLGTALREAFESVWPYIEGAFAGASVLASGLGSALMTAVSPLGKSLIAAFEAAGHALSGILLDAMSNVPGLSHLAITAKSQKDRASEAALRSQAYATDVPGAGRAALDQMAGAMTQAKAAMMAPVDAANQRKAQRDADAYFNDAPKRENEQGLALARADFSAFLQQQKNGSQNVLIPGAFGSDDKPTATRVSALGQAATTTAQKLTAAGNAVQGVATPDAERAGPGNGRMGGRAIPPADMQGLMRSRDLAASGGGHEDTRGANRGTIRQVKGDDAIRAQWDRLNKTTKQQRYGNDPEKWMMEKGGLAAGGWSLRNRDNKNAVRDRANEVFGGGGLQAPVGNPRRQAPEPKAQTQDSTQRVLLQNILGQLRQIATHLGNVTKG